MKNLTSELIAAFFVLVLSGMATIQTTNIAFLAAGIAAAVGLAVLGSLDSYNRIR